MGARPQAPWPPAQLSFPVIVLLSSAVLSFPGASVELNLAAKLTVIHGPGSPHKGYLGAALNTQVEGSGYTRGCLRQLPSEEAPSATSSLCAPFSLPQSA